MVRAYLLPLAILLSASHLLAHDFPAPPVAPQNSHDEITNAFAATALMPPRPAVADKAFWQWNTPSLAMNAADLAQTAQCLVAKECVEQNPLLGANPSMS